MIMKTINELKAKFEQLRKEDIDDFCRAYSRHEFDKWVKDNYKVDEIVSERVTDMENHKEQLLPKLDLEDYLEYHYDIVESIIEQLDSSANTFCSDIVSKEGKGGMYVLAKKLADEFYDLHKDNEWIDEDYETTMNEFISKNIYK